jgi:uncharacterized protein (TIGR00369 family)
MGSLHPQVEAYRVGDGGTCSRRRPRASLLTYDAEQSDRGGTTERERRKVTGAQNVSRMCLVCGAQNALGLQGRFYELEPEGDEGPALLGVFTVREEHQSYPGRLHGGISSAILDETIGRAIRIREPDAWGVTAELTVRYRRPVPTEGEVRAVGRITRDTRRLFEGSGEIVLEDGTVAVEANGRYVKMTIGDITGDDFDVAEWVTDEREHPDEVEL